MSAAASVLCKYCLKDAAVDNAFILDNCTIVLCTIPSTRQSGSSITASFVKVANHWLIYKVSFVCFLFIFFTK